MAARTRELAPAERVDPAAHARTLLDLVSDAFVWLLCLPIRLYRLTLSRFVGQVCRFHPSCSRYALGALHAHGPIKGLGLTVWRIVRCQPFNPGGLDPVPPPTGRRAQRLGIISTAEPDDRPRRD